MIGVTFALLDFAKKYSLKLDNTIIMETGGMKGRGRELIRSEVHDILCNAFGINVIHSEYGMTELLSQAYSKSAGIFYCPPWMKMLVREEDEPLKVQSIVWSSESGARKIQGKSALITHHSSLTGIINVIDLANVYSCSFIASDDAGRLYPDGSFEVLGRMDNSDIRGCSLMTI